jgi:hypothetical protein
MYYEWHNIYLNKENSLFLTILNYFRQILVAFKYFVQSDWRIIVKKLELPYNVKLKTRAGKAMQWSNEKGQNDKQLSTKNYTEN